MFYQSNPNLNPNPNPGRPGVRIPVPFLREPVRLGDAVARITSAVGVKPCSPCEQRRRWLNERGVLNPWNT